MLTHEPKAFTPKLICHAKTAELGFYIEESYNNCGLEAKKAIEESWQIYAVNQKRGRCYHDAKVITIPIWAMKKTEGYLNWYLSHELAHKVAGHEADHGPVFMKTLRSICQPENQHYEIGYMTREAILSGIVAEDF